MRKKASILFLLKLLKIPLNILLLSITAKYYGVSIERDVWLLAYTTITLIDLAIWGPINEVFRTKFILFRETESIESAEKKTQSLITYFILFSLLLMGVIMVFPEFFTKIIAPDYSDSDRKILINMLYFVSPLLIFGQLMQIGLSILNAYEIFNIAEISSLFSTVINILLLVYLAEKLNIYALVLAQYISVLFLLCFIIYYLKIKTANMISFKNWNIEFAGFKSFFLYALPFFFPYFFGQLNGIVEKILAGKLGEGAISILDFSNKIPTLLYGIIISIITTILVPSLTTSFLRNDAVKFNDEFRKMFQMGLIVIGFLISFICGASTPLVSFLYDNGNIVPKDLEEIAILSILYSMSLLGVFFYIIFGMSLLSSKNSRYYALMGVLTQITVVVLNLCFYKVFQKYTFPIAIFIAHLIFGVLMFKKYPYINSLKLRFTKYFFMILLVASTIFIFGNYIFIIDNPFLKIVVIAFCTMIAFVVSVLIFKLEEKEIIVHYLKHNLKFKK